MEETDHSIMDSKSSETETRASKKRRVGERVVVAVKLEENDKRQHRNEGPPSDCWSWRKYGQKPIKGSPYPRGYYRCSTSKGCSAKKQVERCKTDSSMLMVTYTSTHNHPGPIKPPNFSPQSNQDSKQEEQDEIKTSSTPKQEQEESESESVVPRVAVDSEDHIQHAQDTLSTPKQEQGESESESMVARVAVDSEDHLQHAQSPFDSIMANQGGSSGENPFEANLQTPGVVYSEDPKSVSDGTAELSSLLKSENDFFDELEELPTSSFFTSLMKRSFCEDRVIVNPS